MSYSLFKQTTDRPEDIISDDAIYTVLKFIQDTAVTSEQKYCDIDQLVSDNQIPITRTNVGQIYGILAYSLRFIDSQEADISIYSRDITHYLKHPPNKWVLTAAGRQYIRVYEHLKGHPDQ
jgi:hypothetical protein